MDTLVSYIRRDQIGYLCINNPPVNAISRVVVDQLAIAMNHFEADSEAVALVVHCEGRTFVAGGDIADFDRKDFSAEPYNRLLARIESTSRPVIAALHGVVLGGGLELAMACHHRVAHPTTQFGMPEVKLGLLPGSLGTQRLPRLVGAPTALDMMLSGKTVNADHALQMGLVDSISEDQPIPAGAITARAVLEGRGVTRRTSGLTVQASNSDFLDEARKRVASQSAYPAMSAIVRCVQAAMETPFAEGEQIESAEFMALVKSPSAMAMRHIFFAQREASKVPALPRDSSLRDIRKVGVVGAGTMGGGIAMNFANAGIPTVLVEASDEALQRGMALIRTNFEASASKGKLTSQEMLARLDLLSGSLEYASLVDCDLIIEAVFEDLDLKKRICAAIGSVAPHGAIIATNTSTLDADMLAHASGRPADFIGLHFFSPANVMRLLEVVRCKTTSNEVLATVMKLAQKIGKVPVVSGVCFGFIGNRMAEAYLRETEFLLLEGAQPQQIDRAAEALGMAMGPCRMLDMAGIDVGAKIVIERGKTGGLPPDPSYRAVVRKLHEIGRNGQKTGAGYYRYEGRKPLPDPEVTQIVSDLARAHGIEQRQDITQQEIVERLFYPMINEGLNILEEGVAYRPGDIDVVWVSGYGFPDHIGGPMFYADRVGLPVIEKSLAGYASARGNPFGYWTASPMLIRLAQSNGKLFNTSNR